MEFCSLASGSSGNCIYVGHNDTAILVDAGISGKKIEAGLMQLGVNPASVKGILVTHDHCDHTQGAVIYARRFNIPIYATGGTLDFLSRTSRCAPPNSLLNRVNPDEEFRIGDITVHPFRVSHDAIDPVAYTLCADGKKLSMATDLGLYDEYIIDVLSGSDALYIEANHDINMLMLGSYPYTTKLRIASQLGHLSNEACAELVAKVQNENLKAVVLAHISKENNLEELAYETVRQALARDMRFDNCPELLVAKRYEPGKLIRL